MGVLLRDVPFYSQRPEGYWCGPIALQMFIQAHTGRRIPRETLVKLCKTTKFGTTIPNLRAALREVGVRHRTTCNATLSDISDILKETRKPVIVLYREPEDEDLHYALVVGLTQQNIILNDPWHGRGFKLPQWEFVVRWGYWNPWKYWMLWSP